MRQLIYISSIVPGTNVDPAEILRVSRVNNGRDAITGLLFFDGRRFLQALEGEGDMVAAAFARIERDPRHRAIVTLSDRTVQTREFGPWAMALGGADQDADAMAARIAAFVRGAPPSIQATFNGFVSVRRAA